MKISLIRLIDGDMFQEIEKTFEKKWFSIDKSLEKGSIEIKRKSKRKRKRKRLFYSFDLLSRIYER